MAENTPRLLFQLTCANGHPWVAYGPDAKTHWGPVQCTKCAAPWVRAEKLADLASPPKHRYTVRVGQADGLPVQEQVILADAYEHKEGALVFVTDSHVVARLRRALDDPTLLD